ncbi:MAG: class I SAM-dependent methyltransferase [Aquabacterium sp.]
MSHSDRVIDQFTRMAHGFATAPHILDREVLDILLRQSLASPADRSLDVACGAGIVACHFAAVVQHATGIDITPAMLVKARERQASLQLENLTWDLGSSDRLPYADHAFTVVTSRYALHHLEQPLDTLAEMVRVCKPGGTVTVADICVSEMPAKAARFNELERLHDPTHVRAMPLSEHLSLFAAVGLSPASISHYKLDFKLSRLLQALGHRPDAAAAASALVLDSIATDMLGTESRVENGGVVFSYPIAVMTARRPAAGGA